MREIYLDYAASTPLAPEVAEAMRPYWDKHFGNAHANHKEGRIARGAIESARDIVAGAIGAKSDEIFFTSGGTESNSMAVFGVIDAYLEAHDTLKGKNVITSAIEHPSVLDCFKKLERHGAKAVFVGVDKDGIINLDELEKALDENTLLVSVMYANNEVGTIQPISRIGELIKKVRKNSYPYFHTDASQAPLFSKLSVDELGVDLLTVDAQKLYGPKSVGALYIRRGTEIEPIIIGGKQEGGLRPGTLNTPGIVGFGKAYELAEKKRDEDVKHVGAVRDRFVELVQKTFPEVYINGSLESRLPNNINISFPGIEGEYIVIALDEKGIYASTKSACLGGGGEGSYVVAAMDRSRAKNSVRFTLGRETTNEDIDKTVEALTEIVERFQKS